MTSRRWPDLSPRLLALLAGALLPLAFAPFGLYLLVPLLLAYLFHLWLAVPAREAAWRGYAFGLGLFGSGVSWVFVAIHETGQTPAPIAALLTLLFVSFLALYPALIGYLAVRLQRGPLDGNGWQLLAWLPAWWVAGEWFRGWFLSGFPWLNLGYSMIDAPLKGYAPLAGVSGLSLLVAITAGMLLWLWRRGWQSWWWGGALLLLLWGVGGLLERIEWTQAAGEPIRVTLIQGNVPQATKWDPEHIRHRLSTYAVMTREQLAGSDLIIWPENAITVFYHQIAEEYFAPLAEEARAHNTDLILGVPELDADNVRYYTTLMSLGSHHGFYRKRHLVPFGEYMPLEALRGLIDFFDLPMSSFSPGAERQPLLQAAGQKIAATVCYEDAFTEEVRDFLPEATLLVNGSNNAWYGDSLAPHQHLQISRMRALESGRPLLRATTNGISALVDARGDILARGPQFQRAVVSGRVQPARGSTPYVRWGNGPVLLLLGLLLLAGRRAVASVVQP